MVWLLCVLRGYGEGEGTGEDGVLAGRSDWPARCLALGSAQHAWAWSSGCRTIPVDGCARMERVGMNGAVGCLFCLKSCYVVAHDEFKYNERAILDAHTYAYTDSHGPFDREEGATCVQTRHNPLFHRMSGV